MSVKQYTAVDPKIQEVLSAFEGVYCHSKNCFIRVCKEESGHRFEWNAFITGVLFCLRYIYIGILFLTEYNKMLEPAFYV